MAEPSLQPPQLNILKDRIRNLGLWEGSRYPSYSTNVTLSWNPSFLLSYASLCNFFPPTCGKHVSPVNIYKISKGINFIDFHSLAHIWSSHCGQRLKDLYLALSLADLSVETENPSVHMELEDRAPEYYRPVEGHWAMTRVEEMKGVGWWLDHPVQPHLGSSSPLALLMSFKPISIWSTSSIS